MLLSKVLRITGHAYIFFPFEKHSLLTTALTEAKLQFKNKPLIWHVKGEDTYMTFMWVSRALSSPPRYVNEHQSHRRDVTAFHTLAKPYSLLYNLIDNSTTKGSFIVDPSAYDLSAVRVCLETGRNVLANCPSKIVYEQCMKQIAETGGKR